MRKFLCCRDNFAEKQAWQKYCWVNIEMPTEEDIIQNHTSPPAVQIIIQTFYQLSVLIEKEEPLYLMLYFSFSTSGPV